MEGKEERFNKKWWSLFLIVEFFKKNLIIVVYKNGKIDSNIIFFLKNNV